MEFLIVLPRRGLHQCAHVGQHRQRFVRVEQPLQFRQAWMKTKVRLTADLQRQQRCLSERDICPNTLIVGVPRRIDRHDHVVRVVAAEKKDAHQRFVIRGTLRQRAHQSKLAHAGHKRCRRRRAARQPHEVSSCMRRHIPVSLLRASAALDTAMKKSPDRWRPLPGSSNRWSKADSPR